MRKSTTVEAPSITYEVNGVSVTSAADKGATYPQLAKVCNVHFDINFEGRGANGKTIYKHSDGSVVAQETWNQRRGLQSALYSVHKTSNFTAITVAHIQKWIASGKVPAKFVKMIKVTPVKEVEARAAKAKAGREVREAKHLKATIAALKAMGLDVVKADK